jgi:hypothetical protein
VLSEQRSARGRNSRGTRIAVPFAIPLSLGLTLVIIQAGSSPIESQQVSGVVVAVRDGGQLAGEVG